MIEGVKCDGEQNKLLSDLCVAQHNSSDGGSVIVWGVIFLFKGSQSCMSLGTDQDQIYR